jgi:hypothetical protein
MSADGAMRRLGGCALHSIMLRYTGYGPKRW